MKKQAVLKILLMLIIGVMLLAKPISTFAAVSIDSDFWEDQTTVDENTNTNTNTNTVPSTNTTPSTNTNTNTTPSTNTNTAPSTNTNKTNTTKTDIPKAGLVEDTMIIVAVIALMVVAVYTFKKLSDYQNI